MKKTIFCQIVVMSFILLNQDIFALLPGDIELSNGGHVAVRNGKYGIFGAKGNVIVPFIYDDIDDGFHNDRLAVRSGDKYGMIDDYGNIIAPLVFNWIHIIEGEGHDEEREGIANVEKDGIFYILFRDGMCIPEEEWWKKPYRTYNIDKNRKVFYTDDRAVTF